MTDNFKVHGTVDKEFTKVPKAIIRDKSISAEARIILEFLIDLTGDFSINERGLSTILGITEYKVKRAVIELETAGYIRRHRHRIMNGSKFGGWFWDISTAPIFRSDVPSAENQLVENQISEKQLVENQFENQLSEIQTVENQLIEKHLYIKDRKDTRPTDKRLKEEETIREETEGREIAPTLTPLYRVGESIISSGEVNINQAFNRFCEVYPNLGDIDRARAAFSEIPDIGNICWQIVNSVEWFEKSKKWDDWQTGQKNVSCPQAAKFLKRGDWQQFMKSNRTVSTKERILAILSKENAHEDNG